jgi:hypothetical protein
MPADCRWLERRALKNYKVYSFQRRTKSWKEELSFRFMLDGILTHDTVPQHTRERCSLTVLHIVESLVNLIMVLVVLIKTNGARGYFRNFCNQDFDYSAIGIQIYNIAFSEFLEFFFFFFFFHFLKRSNCHISIIDFSVGELMTDLCFWILIIACCGVSG